jgi:hypothetical protein
MAAQRGEQSALEAVQAEADLPDDGSVVVELSTDEGKAGITIPPAGQWKTRATRALTGGNFDEWAEIVLSDADFATWVDLDPTLDDVSRFFTEWQASSGADLGKSRSLRTSLRSTARR